MKPENFEKVENSVPQENNAESANILDKFRSKVLTSMCLGYAALLSACGELKREDIEKMPLTKIEDVLKEPEQFIQIPLVKVGGFPVKIGTDKEEITIPTFDTDEDGDLVFKGFDHITQEVDIYDIHTTSDLKSLALRGYAKGDTIYFPNLPLEPDNKRLSSFEYEIAGKLHASGNGESRSYKLEIKGSVEKPQLELPEKK